MKVLQQYDDGSQTVQYEVGDRVVFKKDQFIGSWRVDSKGDRGTVIRAARLDAKYPSLAFLDVQSDKAKEGGWGTTHVPPWDLELEAAR
jgi:hypothetical protein